MPRPKSADPADRTLPVRFTKSQVQALDRLRRPGETRSAAIRRIFDRVAYAEEVALAAAGEAHPPAPDDPRAAETKGITAIVFPPRPDPEAGTPTRPEGVVVGVVDTRSGVTLHETERLIPVHRDPRAELEDAVARIAELERILLGRSR